MRCFVVFIVLAYPSSWTGATEISKGNLSANKEVVPGSIRTDDLQLVAAGLRTSGVIVRRRRDKWTKWLHTDLGTALRTVEQVAAGLEPVVMDPGPLKGKDPMDAMKRRPKMVVFDLNFTMWPFAIDYHTVPPFYKNKIGEIKDEWDFTLDPYPESGKALKFLSMNNITASAASRTAKANATMQLLQLYGWDKYLKNIQLYPGEKTDHIKSISNETKVDVKDMLVFDDNENNIKEIGKLGAVCYLVKEGGITLFRLIEGLRKFQFHEPKDTVQQ